LKEQTKYKMNRLLIFALSSFFVICGFAQQTPKPKLVVGIVVDQMRYDYLTRFENKYGNRGFNRLISEGYNCKNHHFNYIPTYTAPGHASIYTGTTPRYHGVISNSWYDKSTKRTVYCAGDQNVLSVGTSTVAGKMSPHRMLSTTFADENRLFTQMQGKTIGISLKDRGAILPAGHTANAAYWFTGGKEGNMVTSSFYMTELPKWVNAFNASKTVENYLTPWDTLYDIEKYSESGTDLNDYEGGFYGKETPTFPYDLKTLSLSNGDFDILRTTPFGNSIVTDFAIAAIKGEKLGSDDVTDVLAISYSSTDYIGHNFGVNSKEIEDTYIRLDKEIERLLDYLDGKIGRGEYTLFLTSDHGAVNVPGYLKSLNIPAGYLKNTDTRQKLNMFMTTTFRSADLIENISNSQVFLNHEKITEMKLDLGEVQEAIVNELITYEHIDKVFTANAMRNTYFDGGIEKILQNGFHQKRSGDVIIVNNPSLISYSTTGSTHGSGYNYDTHVPLIFFGNGIKPGSTYEKTIVSDVAPTISALLNISFPNAATGKPLTDVLGN